MSDYTGCNPQVVGDRKDAEIAHLHNCLRMIRNHWNEFGPEHGFENTLEVACKAIDINKGVGSTWDGLPKSPAIG